ncbi:MAG: BON domain-containing protein [Epsilonproteobacteria bacterium]|nr:BON domain-containing protein [Campylobacterota bacterium]
MKKVKLLSLLLVPIMLSATEPAPKDNPVELEFEKALEGFILLLQKATETAKDLSQTEQEVIPEEKDTFRLYYREVSNKAKVESRNDTLIKAQVSYKLYANKKIPASTLMVVVKDGEVELYGKALGEEGVEEAIKEALRVKGVKSVTSYVIIKKPATTTKL